MKNSIQARFTVLRRISILPFLLGVFCLLCFTEGKGETRFVMNDKEDPTVIPGNGMVDTTAMSGILDQVINTTNIDLKVNNISNLSEEDIDKEILKTSGKLGLAIDELAITLKAKNPASRLLSLQKVIQLLEINVNSSAGGQNQINEQFCATVTNEDLVNAKTNFTQLKKEMDALKLEKGQLVKTQKFGILVMSMIQNNLVSKVLEAQMGGLTTMLQDMMTPMLKTMGKTMENLTTEMKENPETDTNNPEEIIEPKVEENEYKLKPSQVKISRMPFTINDNFLWVIAIVKNQKATKVTIGISIKSDNFWISFDKGFTMIDKKNQDQYIIRSLEGELPLNQKILVSGYNHKVLEFTLVFPPLKKSVEVVDLVEFLSEEDGTSSVGFSESNVRIKDYLKKESGKVYK